MSKFTFGTPATTANSSFTFGTQKPATSAGLGGTTFGAPAPTAGANPSFGAAPPAATAPAAPSLNFSFGAATTSAVPAATPAQPTNLLLGGATAPAAAPSLFGTPAAAPAAPATGLTFGATATPGATTFGAPTSAAAPAGLNFGTPATSAPSLFGAGTGGLFGAKTPATVAPVTTTSTNKGLGGLDVSVSNKGLSHGSNSPTVAKENLIPNELTQTIDSFKEFVKTQKGFSSDIARGSSRPLHRCSEDETSLMEMLTSLAGSVQRDRCLADKLKQDTARALQSAEIAQRTHDTPPGLQYENNAPLHFFLELAESFEQEIALFRSQIEATEKHIHTMMAPRTLAPQELTAAMSKIHETLVAIAGRLQGVHSKVQQQKEQYLNFRKYVLKDSSNVFEEANKVNGKTGRPSIGRVTSGPTPFSPGNKSFLSSTAINTGRPPSYGTQNPLAWGNSTPQPGSMNLGLGPTKPPTTGLNFNPPLNLTAPLGASNTGDSTNSSFQLQKPPAGNKRGKY